MLGGPGGTEYNTGNFSGDIGRGAIMTGMCDCVKECVCFVM